MGIYKSINNKQALKTHGAMKNCLQYIMSPEKTDVDHCFVVGDYSGDPMDVDAIYRAFLEVKNKFDADNGRQYGHFILSFKDEEMTPDLCLSFALDFAERVYEGHQTAIACHVDADNIHCHMVVNTVNFIDGSKLHKSKKDLENDKKICNELCEQYGLKIAEKGKHFDGSKFEDGQIIAWSKEKYHLMTNSQKPSFLVDCALVLQRNLLEHTTSREDFTNAMSKCGWKVIWTEKRKNITFINEKGNKVRDKNIQKSFGIDVTKEGILNAIERTRTATERAKGSNPLQEQNSDRRNEQNEQTNKRTANCHRSI